MSDEGDELEDLSISQGFQNWIELTAPSHERVIFQLEELLDRMAERGGISDSAKLKMAIREITANAIEWGNKGDEARQIKVSYCQFEGRLVFKIEDEGEGFDPAQVFDPSEDPFGGVLERLEAGKRFGGYGMVMVRNIMDEVLYNDRGNVVLLTKYLDD